MKDEGKNKKDLIQELEELRRRVAELKESETELRRVEKTLKESEEKYRDLIDHTGTALIIVEEDRTISLANSEFVKLSGYSKNEIEGRKKSEDFAHPEDVEKLLRYHSLRRKNPGDSPREYESRLVNRFGEIKHTFNTVALIPGTAKSIVSFLNITERKQAEEALRDNEEHYRTVIEQSNDGISISKGEELIQVNRKFLEIFGYDDPAEVTGKSIAVHIDPEDRQKVLEYALKRAKGEPVPSSYEFKGLRKNREPLHIEVSVARIISRGEALILTVLRDITKRKQTEEALRASEEKYRLITDNSNDWIYLIRQDKTFHYVSPSSLRITGYTSIEFINNPRLFLDIIYPDDKALVESHLEIVPEETGAHDLEFRIITKTGELRWIRHSCLPVHDEKGHYVGRAGTNRDITQRKEGEEALQDSEERYRSLFEMSPYVVVVHINEKIVLVNPAGVTLLGGKSDRDILGLNLFDQFFLPEYREQGRERARIVNETGLSVPPTEYRFRRLDGTIIDVNATGKVITYGGRNAILSIYDDITERKQAEAALRLSEEKYQLLVNNTNEGVMVYQDSVIKFINPRVSEITGYSPDELLSKSLLDLVHPDDHAIVRERASRRLRGEPVKPVNIYKGIAKDGHIQWIELNAITSTWEGRPANLYFFQDITERKKAEEDLKESREHFRSLMESASNFAVYRLAHDKKNPFKEKVIFVSPSIQEIMGITDPFTFKSWVAIMNPDDLGTIKAANYKAFETLRFNETFRFFHPQKKEWRWINVMSSGVEDEERQTKYFNGIIIDITDKKKAEDALREAYDTLDDRVKVRTHQLQLANERLQTEIEERKLVEGVLRKSKDQLRLLSNRLINAQENERKRVAIELHDDLGQSLIGLKLQLSRFQNKLEGNQTELKQEIKQAFDSVDLMTEKVRRLSRDLRPAVLEHLSLFEALHWLFKDTSKNYQIKLFNNITKREFSFSKEQDLIVFRIFQEALTNIGKHAQATQIDIGLTEKGRSAVFSIKDNGKGFNPKAMKGRKPSEIGLGLTAMAERAQMAGGTLDIKSETGKGTVITFSIPLRRTRKKSTS